MSHTELPDEPAANPINIVEQLAAANNWAFDRSDENEISLTVEGRYCEYHVSFQMMEEIEVLHIACAFDLKVPQARLDEVIKLLASVNEQLHVGHYDLWGNEGLVMYRNSLMLAGGATASSEQCRAIFNAAFNASERCYPAFQYVIWAGKTAKEAMEGSLFETAGEA